MIRHKGIFLERKKPPRNNRKTVKIIIDGKTYTYFVHKRQPSSYGYVTKKKATVTKNGKTKPTRPRRTKSAIWNDEFRKKRRHTSHKQLLLPIVG